MKNENSQLIDVHVFEYNERGENVYGVPYPFDSLTGNGKIENQSVNCINPKWMFKFKLWANDTSYEPREKDVINTQMLSEKFVYKLPEKYM